MHPDEERRVAALLEDLGVLGPLVLNDPLAARVELLREQRVERPALPGAVAVHDDDLGGACGARASHGGVDLLRVELAAFLVERLAAVHLLPLDDSGDTLHVADHEDAHAGHDNPGLDSGRWRSTTAVSLNGEDLTRRRRVGCRRRRAAARSLTTRRAAAWSPRGRSSTRRPRREGEHTYGINTGFGRFVERTIPPELSEELQLRLLRSHACGVGDPYPDEIVRAAMVLRANTLAKGYSGARVETVELLLECLNRGVLPVVPSRGSVGASGDLAPLAHLALPLVGEGWAIVDGERLPGCRRSRTRRARARAARGEGGALAHQRHAVHERSRLARRSCALGGSPRRQTSRAPSPSRRSRARA